MKRLILVALMFIAFKVAAQSPVPAQEADKFVGQVMCTYGYVLKTTKEGPSTYILFGSKYDLKGITLKLTDEMKLEPEANFEDLKGRFITVTGAIVKDKKGRIIVNGDDPNTSIMVKQALVIN